MSVQKRTLTKGRRHRQTDRQAVQGKRRDQLARACQIEGQTEKTSGYLKREGGEKIMEKKEREMKLMRALGSAGPLNVDG